MLPVLDLLKMDVTSSFPAKLPHFPGPEMFWTGQSFWSSWVLFFQTLKSEKYFKLEADPKQNRNNRGRTKRETKTCHRWKKRKSFVFSKHEKNFGNKKNKNKRRWHKRAVREKARVSNVTTLSLMTGQNIDLFYFFLRALIFYSATKNVFFGLSSSSSSSFSCN